MLSTTMGKSSATDSKVGVFGSGKNRILWIKKLY